VREELGEVSQPQGGRKEPLGEKGYKYPQIQTVT
jgi:hypothetical protein